MPVTIIVPDYMPYFIAVLGLLVLWEVHEMQVRAGKIQAKDFWDRTGIRMFVRITPQDAHACAVCKDHCGIVLLAANSRKARATLHAGCTNPAGCRCLLVGLYGGWPDAQKLLDRMKQTSSSVHFTTEDLRALLGGPWERSVSASVDRVSVHLLEAMLSEQTDPDAAAFRYRFVIDHAGTDRDLPFVVPAYLRLTDLHRSQKQIAEALAVIERFDHHYPEDRTVPHAPNANQRSFMKAAKQQLLAAR
ncbi:MAG TPA: hypothetical protein VFA38_06135 [Nitrospirales bacterium]|nr:hypothetical protein [Nitrospirales bacterium]